jgi:hypothetical protein
VTGDTGMVDNGRPFFQPDGIRWLERFVRRLGLPTLVRMPVRFRAGLDCGLVWNNPNPKEPHRIVERLGIAIGVKKEEPEL